jgi:hypothetical protein
MGIIASSCGAPAKTASGGYVGREPFAEVYRIAKAELTP